MKRIFLTLMVVFLALGLIGFTGCAKKTDKSAAEEEMTAPKGLGPMVVMGTPVVKMSKNSSAVIMGTGFKPKQEVRVLFATQDGLQSDIGYALKPEPKVDASGTWGTTWSAGRYVARKLIKPEGGAYTITAADADYNPIASTVVTFVPEKKKKKKK